jgi:transcriptional regulator with XRE-family HTH domain
VPSPATPDPALATVIRAVRLERGLTQEDAAHASGVTVASFARIERGQSNPTWVTVRAIAGALDLPLSELGQRIEHGQS